MIKSVAKLCLACVLIMTLLPFAALDSTYAESELSFVINGEAYMTPSGEPTPFLNEDNRTMVPLRFFTNALTDDPPLIEWHQADQRAVIQHNDNVLEITNGESQFLLNNQIIAMDTSASIIDQRMFVPLRFVSQGLGAQIHWEQQTHTVYLQSGKIDIISSSEAEALIADRADEVLHALAVQDMQTVAAYVHPEKGVRFTPYTFVNEDDHLVFMPEELENAFASSAEYTWGAYDGSGEPIKLTFAEYYDEFIFDHDYREADQVSYNEQLFTGNATNNAPQVYPGSIIVEYHFDGFEEQYEGMDWSSLRLVFQEHNDDWMLVGIIHDQWTI